MGPILDLGCGNGRNTFYFATKGYKVYALDFIPSVLNRIAEAKHPNVKVVKHSLPRRLPFKSASIGLVLDFITTASLNTAQLKQMRLEIHRVLRPGGFFLTYCLSDKNSYHAALKRTPRQKFVTIPNGIRDRIWNVSDLIGYYNNLTPQFVYIRHKNEQVGDWFGPLEMVLALFRKE